MHCWLVAVEAPPPQFIALAVCAKFASPDPPGKPSVESASVWCPPCRFDLAPCPANHLWLYPVVREYKETHQRADAVLQRAMEGDTGARRSRLTLLLK